jgi:hypothetical protein
MDEYARALVPRFLIQSSMADCRKFAILRREKLFLNQEPRNRKYEHESYEVVS